MSEYSDLDQGQTLRTLRPGQRVFQRFTLGRILGRGGMGIVWQARDEKLSRDVALKFLPDFVMHDRMALADLKRETNRSLGLTHPHIVRIYDFVEDEAAALACISMELVEGGNLSNLRADREHRCFEVAELQGWTRELCEALAYAHERAKVVHRDLKPANLMLDGGGELKVADFGVARSLVDSASRASAHAGATSGTLIYMSPQQALGQPSTALDDIYALGATLFDLLTSRPPFHTGNIYEQLKEVIPTTMAERRAQLGITGAPIPAAWEQTVAACLAKNPSLRPQSAREVAQRLGFSVAGAAPRAEGPAAVAVAPVIRVPRRHSPGPAIAATALILAAGIAAGWWFGLEQPRRAHLAQFVQEQQAQLAAEQSQRDTAAKQHREELASRTMEGLVAGRTALAEGKWSEAQDHFEQVLALDPTSLEAAKSKARITEHLAAARGRVAITTDPPGATVQIGESPAAKSPCTIEQLRLGPQTVTLSFPGYEPLDRSIHVEENRTADPGVLKLVRSTGKLSLETTPSGLAYELSSDAGEKHPGQTPAILESLPTGTYTVKFTREKWPAVTRTVEVVKGAVAKTEATFQEGSLQLTSDPLGATVTRGSQTLGSTPLLLESLPPGTQTFTLSKKGYNSKTLEIEVRAAEHSKAGAKLDLDPRENVPANAKALIGRYKGEDGELNVSLAPEGTALIVRGSYGSQQRGEAWRSVSQGSFESRIPIARINAGKVRTSIDGRFTHTLTYDEGHFYIPTGQRTATFKSSTGTLVGSPDRFVLQSSPTLLKVVMGAYVYYDHQR